MPPSPSSSRKRNKGKERKAKQQAKKEQNLTANAGLFWRRFCIGPYTGQKHTENECDHGCDITTDDHPVTNFMDLFYINLHREFTDSGQQLRKIFKSHKQIWNNESYRKAAIDIFTRIGTNLLLSDSNEEIPCGKVQSTYGSTIIIANVIIALEHYDGEDDIDSVINKRAVGSKWRDLYVAGSTKRDVLKFFRKRTTCKCLKKMHLEARKSTPKMGECWSCDKKMERVSLSVCSQCMIPQYCSRECQVANWPVHKRSCEKREQVGSSLSPNE